jgi:hypothetical protein
VAAGWVAASQTLVAAVASLAGTVGPAVSSARTLDLCSSDGHHRLVAQAPQAAQVA